MVKFVGVEPITPLGRGRGVIGSTTTNLTISNVQSNELGPYVLVVTNSFGSVTSSPATLTLLVPAGIATEPTDQVAALSGTAFFSISATGAQPLFYQWQKNGTNLADGGRISGAASPTLTLSTLDLGDN